MVKNPPVKAGDVVPSLRQEDPVENGTVIHSSILPWRIPRTEETGGLRSIGSKRVGHDKATKLPPPTFVWALGLPPR